MKMQLLNSEIQEGLTGRTATFQLWDGSVVIYKDWLHHQGEIIDCVIRTKDGQDITHEEPDLFDLICEFLDENGESVFNGESEHPDEK